MTGGSITQVAGGSVSNVENFTLDLGAGSGDLLNYASTLAAQNITVNLATGSATGFTSIAGVENVTGGAGADTLTGDGNANTLTGGLGADTMSGGLGIDRFTIASGQSLHTTAGSGDSGTFAGYDVINDFTPNAGGDVLDLEDTAAFGNTTANGTASSLTIGGETIKSHQVTNGIVTFDDQVDYSAALTLSSLANVAAAVEYINRNDFGGGNGNVVAFVANIGGTAHTYVFNQLGGNGNANDILVDLVGVTLTNLSGANLAPAGVAGEAINLALTDPADHVGAVNVNIIGVPAGWALSEGTNNGDGTWSVQTNDVTALSITAPETYAGAVVLKMSVTWTDSTGGTGLAMITNNVEAYSPGSPIFAVSSDDHLTGSSNADLFVFAQPIANDTIHNFNATADKIDLIGFDGVSGMNDLAIANDANGNAVITMAAGSTITVLGVDASALGMANFEFNVEPHMTNSGTMTISNGAILPLGGTIDNSGTIALASTGSETDLQILVESVTLQGGGHVTLSDSDQNVIFGGSAAATLHNVDNTISGAGHLGAGQMTLVNEGTILADGEHALVIDTGSNLIHNSGTLEATGHGGLVVESGVDNAGHLWANDGDITIHGDVTGDGDATISGAATLEFDGASSADTTFSDGDGTLALDHASDFTGTVSGFNHGDLIDFGDIVYGSGSGTTISYAANADGSGGTLNVSDGAHTASIALQGDYTTAGFEGAYDQGSGTAVAYDSAHAGGDIDQLVLGGTGNDTLTGGIGNDSLSGGAGADIFKATAGNDHITDYNKLLDGDMLDISGLLANATRSNLSVTNDGTDHVRLTVSDGAAEKGGVTFDNISYETGMSIDTLLGYIDVKDGSHTL